MNDLLPHADELSRRRFITVAASSLLGVSFLSGAQLRGSEALGAEIAGPAAKAKQVIYLFMQGAMSHLDTLDPKPGAESQGPTQSIKTAVSGVALGESLPKLAKNFNKTAIVRSLGTATGDHEQGRYLMHTSYALRATIRHASLGPWAQALLGKRNAQLPDTVLVGAAGRHPGAGFLGPKFAPLPINDPAAGLQYSKPPSYLSEKQFDRRMALTNQFDRHFRDQYKQESVSSYTDFYRETIKLMDSKDLAAFDINQEPQAMRDNYGANRFGQGCLLARRLVQHGVRFVEVQFGSWDTHVNNFEEVPERAATLDQALEALLLDLEAQGLLSETMVVLATEFGRSPKINQNNGRDHHPPAFSCLLAGGGIRGGQVYGATDDQGFHVADDSVTPADFNATIAHALGLPLDKEMFSTSGRPFKVAEDGKPIMKLFS